MKPDTKAESTYLDKEKELIRAIVQSNGGPMFDSKEEAIDFVAKTMSAFPEYVNTVVNYQVKVPLIYARYEGAELQDRVMEIDRQRRNAHEAAIASVNILNRVCDKFGLEPFADVDTSDRTKVADFCGRFVNETYNKAIGGTMDSVTMGSRETYESRKTHERLNQMAEAMGLDPDAAPGGDYQGEPVH